MANLTYRSVAVDYGEGVEVMCDGVPLGTVALSDCGCQWVVRHAIATRETLRAAVTGAIAFYVTDGRTDRVSP